MKKNLLLLFLAFFMITNISYAQPVIELAAPRVINPNFMPEVDDEKPMTASPSSKTSTKIETTNQKSNKKNNHKKKVHKKPAVLKPDYKKISKYIEYGYYNYADNLLEKAICINKNNEKAQALLAVSMAKQLQLDSAQKKVDELLKKYPKNSDLHYAQGIINYQRTTSSNMTYRDKKDELINSALNEFKTAIRLDKTNAKAYNAAGVISLMKGDTKNAKVYFNQAVNIDTTYSMAIDNLGTIDFIEKKYENAQKKFNDALKFNSKNTTAMYHLAQVAVQNKDYNSAIKYLNNALCLNQNSFAVLNLLGKVYYQQGNDAAAINAFKKSIEIRPEFSRSYIDLATIYEKRGDSEFAIEQLKNVLSVEPDLAVAKVKIADISYSNGNFNQAIAYYSQLIGTPQYNDIALKGIANSYYSQAQTFSNKGFLGSNSNLYKALESINKAIESNNQDLELHLAKLKLTDITNQPDESKVILNKIISSPQKDLLSLITKGEAYLTLNDYKNAQVAFDEAITKSDSLQNDLYLAEIFTYHKQYDNACKIIDKILKADPKNQEALCELDYIQKSKKYADNYYKSAQIYLKSGKSSLANEYLARSISINPNNANARLELAKILDKQKDYQEAIKNYKAYLSLSEESFAAERVKKRIQRLENKL